jgi:uncharacterized membrane protein
MALFAIGLALFPGILWATNLTSFAAPVALLFGALLPWFAWRHQRCGVRNRQARVALFCRLLLAFGFVLLLAQPRWRQGSEVLSLVYALDVSDSIDRQARDEALGFVTRTVQQRPHQDEAGLVVFARRAAVELPPRTAFPFETINSRISGDGSNLEGGLAMAAAVLPEAHNGRIVLISDGAATGGQLDTVLHDLRRREIPVDVLPIDYQYAREVALERLSLPRQAEPGESFVASVLIRADNLGKGQLELSENGASVYRKTVHWQAGKTRIDIPLSVTDSGYLAYSAKLSVPRGADGWEANNQVRGHLHVAGPGRVLILAGADSPDAQVLGQAIGERCERRNPAMAPRDPLALMPYDALILANIPADRLDYDQQAAIRDAVFNQGMGLLMTGGAHSFGAGGWRRSPIEEALPVDMEVPDDLPKAGLVIILHTCEFSEGNAWAKRIAKAAIKVLGDDDEVGLIAWLRKEEWIFHLTPAAEFAALSRKINRATPADMPSFVAPVEMALSELRGSDAAVRHVVIISDGDPKAPPPALLKGCVDYGVTISTVLVDGFHQGAYEDKMQAIADTTGGRFHYPQSPDSLPAIFVKEASSLRQELLRNSQFHPRLVGPADVLRGLGALPQLHGFVMTAPKADAYRCTLTLAGPDPERNDPILALGNFGIGRSAAFTSDIGGPWSRDWMRWQGRDAFVRQLVSAIARREGGQRLHLEAWSIGNEGIVTVDDPEGFADGASASAMITGPEGRIETVSLRQVAPARFQARFPLWGDGRYQVAASRGASKRASGGFDQSYSAEYRRRQSDRGTMAHIAAVTGGRVLGGRESGSEIFADRGVRISTRPVFDAILIALICLLPIDVAMRRLRLARRPAQGAATLSTLEALKARKQQHEQSRRRSPPPAPESSPTRTTSHLLDRKRKRD